MHRIMEVKDILKKPITIAEEASLYDAVEKMITDKTNSLLVIDTEGKLVGEVNASDLLYGVVPDFLDGDSVAAHFATEEMFDEAVRDSAKKQITYFMSTCVEPVKLDDSLMEVATRSIKNKRVHIPVVNDDGTPAGIISRRGLKQIIGNALGIKDSD